MTKREALLEAYRARANAIGLLACCSCLYPTKQYETATFHALDCQAHTMTLSRLEAGGENFHIAAWRKL